MKNNYIFQNKINLVRREALQISLIAGAINRRQLGFSYLFSRSICCNITGHVVHTWQANNFLELTNFDLTDLLKGSQGPLGVPRPYFENCCCLVHQEMG